MIRQHIDFELLADNTQAIKVSELKKILKVMKDSKELDTLINILNSAKLEHLDTNDFAGWKYLIKLYDNNQNKKELKSLTITSNELMYIKTSENNSYCKATSDLEKAISEFLN